MKKVKNWQYIVTAIISFALGVAFSIQGGLSMVFSWMSIANEEFGALRSLGLFVHAIAILMIAGFLYKFGAGAITIVLKRKFGVQK